MEYQTSDRHTNYNPTACCPCDLWTREAVQRGLMRPRCSAPKRHCLASRSQTVWSPKRNCLAPGATRRRLGSTPRGFVKLSSLASRVQAVWRLAPHCLASIPSILPPTVIKYSKLSRQMTIKLNI